MNLYQRIVSHYATFWVHADIQQSGCKEKVVVNSLLNLNATARSIDNFGIKQISENISDLTVFV